MPDILSILSNETALLAMLVRDVKRADILRLLNNLYLLIDRPFSEIECVDSFFSGDVPAFPVLPDEEGRRIMLNTLSEYNLAYLGTGVSEDEQKLFLFAQLWYLQLTTQGVRPIGGFPDEQIVFFVAACCKLEHYWSLPAAQFLAWHALNYPNEDTAMDSSEYCIAISLLLARTLAGVQWWHKIIADPSDETQARFQDGSLGTSNGRWPSLFDEIVTANPEMLTVFDHLSEDLADSGFG